MLKTAQHLEFLWAGLWPQRLLFLSALFCTAVSAGIFMLMPYWAGRLVASILPGQDLRLLIWHLLLGLSFYGLAALFSFGRIYLMTRMSHVITAKTRTDLFRHILSTSPRAATVFGRGELVSILSNDLQLFLESLTQVVAVFTPSIIQVLIFGTAMFYYSWELSVCVIVLISPLALVTSYFGRKLHGVAHQTQDQLAGLMGDIAEMLGGQKEIKSCNREGDMADRFAARNDATLTVHLQREKLDALHPVAVSLAAGSAIAALIFVSALFLQWRILSMQALTSFLVCAALCYSPIQSASHSLGRLTQFFALRDRFEGIMAIPSEKGGSKRLPADQVKGEIEFDRVSFSYGANAFAISEFSLYIPAGQRLAIVGPSGGGKSTLLDLISRFLVADRGVIRIDGEDSGLVRLADLRQLIGEVFQEPVLFAGTLLDNLCFAAPQASPEAVRQAARAAHVEEFALKLPGGYMASVDAGGTNLSLGQRQRIAIARAFLKNPPILLLDEPTSALDAESERLVHEALERASQGRTTLVVAHRLATVQAMDRVLVIDNGCIVGDGTHAGLYQRGGLYRRLCQEHLAGPGGKYSSKPA